MTTSAKKGLHNTGSVPYGYRLEGESAVPDGDRAEFVKHVSRHTQTGRRPPSYTVKCSAAASIQKSTGAR